MGRRHPLIGRPFTIGRGDSCGIRIVDNSVSRKHVLVDPAADGYVVIDLGSTNGTFINDRPVAAPQTLRDGDYLRVGNCLYRYLAGGNVEAEYHEEIYRLTIQDALTRVNNRRALLDFLDREVTRSQRHRRPVSVLMLDIDKFKALNDEHGHLCGDFVLRELAECVQTMVRTEDLFARYGGEEFTLVLVEAGPDEAAEAAERVRVVVEANTFRFETTPIRLTVSIGAVTTTGGAEVTPTSLLRAADEKLYQAKLAGRNRVACGSID